MLRTRCDNRAAIVREERMKIHGWLGVALTAAYLALVEIVKGLFYRFTAGR